MRVTVDTDHANVLVTAQLEKVDLNLIKGNMVPWADAHGKSRNFWDMTNGKLPKVQITGSTTADPYIFTFTPEAMKHNKLRTPRDAQKFVSDVLERCLRTLRF